MNKSIFISLLLCSFFSVFGQSFSQEDSTLEKTANHRSVFLDSLQIDSTKNDLPLTSSPPQQQKQQAALLRYISPIHLGPPFHLSILHPFPPYTHLSPLLPDRLGLYHIPPIIKFQKVPSNDMKVYIKMERDTLGFNLEGLEGIDLRGEGTFSFKITGDGNMVLDLREGDVNHLEFLDFIVYDDTINSDSVVIRFDNGDKFIGKVIDGKIHGNGKAFFNNGDQYEGEFEYGNISGKGKFSYLDGDKYEGEVFNGLPHGQGTVYFANGDRYEGMMDEGKMHGEGTYYYKNGRIYSGIFQLDEIDGKGTIKYVNGNRYSGYLKSGLKHGPGQFYRGEKLIYSGNYLRDKRHGNGLLYYNNGDWYTGNFKEGKMDGVGVLYFNNGDRYEGAFWEGKMHGKGTYYFKDGKRFEGRYVAGKRQGIGTLYMEYGDYLVGDFRGQFPTGEAYYFIKKKKENEYKVKLQIYENGELIKMKNAKSVPSQISDHPTTPNKPSSL